MPQISEWGKYEDLLLQLQDIKGLDWQTWGTWTQSLLDQKPELWGVPEGGEFAGKGIADLVGEIYGVPAGQVDMDAAAEFGAEDGSLMQMLRRIVEARPAAEFPGYEGWGPDYFLYRDPDDGKLKYAIARDAEEWLPTEETVEAVGMGATVEPYLETGYFTKYANDQYTFGVTEDATVWYPTYQQLLDAIAARTGAQVEGRGTGRNVEPYLETGYFTKYANDQYTFGETEDATVWYPTYQQLLDAIAARTGAQVEGRGTGRNVEPYLETGYFTKYANDQYTFGETEDATVWYPTYQQLLDAIAARTEAQATGAKPAEAPTSPPKVGSPEQAQRIVEGAAQEILAQKPDLLAGRLSEEEFQQLVAELLEERVAARSR